MARFDYRLSHIDGAGVVDQWERWHVSAPDWKAGALAVVSDVCGHLHSGDPAAPCEHGTRVSAWRESPGRPETIRAGAVIS